MYVYGQPQEEQKRFKPIEFLTILLAILNITAFLMVEREKIPSWFWWSSLITLSLLVGYLTLTHYGKSSETKIGAWNRRRKQNAIAKKYFSEFKELIKSGRYDTPEIFDVISKLRTEFEPKIKEKYGLLPIYLIQHYSKTKVENLWNSLIYILETFKGITLRDLILAAEQFETILYVCKENIELASIFAIEIKKEYKIPDHVEREFEAFREKYNDYMKDCREFFNKLNQELDKITVSKSSFEYIKKW